MARRLPLKTLAALALVLAVAAPAAGDDIGKKRSIDKKISALQSQVSATREKEDALRSQIAAVTHDIRQLEAEVVDVSRRLAPLQHDLDLHQRRLDALTQLFRLETAKLRFLHEQFDVSVQRLHRRIVDIYESDAPTSFDVVFSARSFSDMLDQIDFLNQIGELDRRISEEVAAARQEVRLARERTKRSRTGVAAETRTIAVRAAQVREVRDRLASAHGKLTTARARQRASLRGLTAEERASVEEIDALRASSAELEAKIRAAQAPAAAPGVSSTSVDSTPSSAGLIWPAAGPVTSPFGWRWGRMHEGIDIGAGYASPIHAAASGTVIYAGWLGGYGNLVVIDHGNGVATAYGHQSTIAVGYGQQVVQGQVIGYVGSTGHSTGPHLHFEVRINGSPVDPLGYL